MTEDKKTQSGQIGRFPPIGGRIIKTAVAVFICLLVCFLRGRTGSNISADAAITAIICMQPYVKDSRDYALNRFAGTLIGSVWGLLFLLLLAAFPQAGSNMIVLYALMAVGVLLALYSAVLIRHPDTSGLAAIVFICIVIAFPDIEDPLRQAGNRFLDVLIGTGAAIGVNIFRLPREKNRNTVFFLRAAELVPDRFSQIAPAVLFRLNYLYNDGARICLMTEHAPAFFVSQMSMAKLSTPLIVMDGAAIYDINENRYLYMEPVPVETSVKLREKMDRLGAGYFIYTIHKNRTCIFHHGEMTAQERAVYDQMRRSPYRNYLEGEIYDSKEVVYYKIIDTQARVAELLTLLSREGGEEIRRLRPVIRPQHSTSNLYALYLYSGKASMDHARGELMHRLFPQLEQKEFRLRTEYRSEREALHLLHLVERSYEPVKRPWKRKKGKEGKK